MAYRKKYGSRAGASKSRGVRSKAKSYRTSSRGGRQSGQTVKLVIEHVGLSASGNSPVAPPVAMNNGKARF